MIAGEAWRQAGTGVLNLVGMLVILVVIGCVIVAIDNSWRRYLRGRTMWEALIHSWDLHRENRAHRGWARR